jgi:hypothetical protein
MFVLEILTLTLFIYLILNFSKLRRGIFSGRDLVFPFSAALAGTIVDSFIKTAFIAALLAFIVIFAACFWVLYFITAPRK